MIVEIKIPSPGESISEVEIAQWLVEDSDYVQKDQEVGEIESDKATLPLIAEKAGKISIQIEAGNSANVGDIACTIDTSAEAPKTAKKKEPSSDKPNSTPKEYEEQPTEPQVKTEAADNTKEAAEPKIKTAKATPLAKKLMEENGLNIDDIINGLKKITTQEVKQVLNTDTAPIINQKVATERNEDIEKMSSLRRKISQRLVSVKNETAMLTTFNEVDMSAIMNLRKKYQKQFIDKYGIKLGFMSFFTKAVTIALQNFPKINSYLDGESIVSPNYVDVGIAVQTDKGLMVPIVRDTQNMSIPEIELAIMELAKKARIFRITPEEMTGGTFTITNGGVFGSMLSTPILNPPQSGILGMHNIIERPVAVDGQVVIRPMMYTALSYDHRIVDGRESVSFLVKVKELLESPHKLMFGQHDADKSLLGL